MPKLLQVRRPFRVLAAAAVVAAFSAAPALPPPPTVVRGPVRRFLVHFEDVVRNEGDAPLENVVCRALLPLDLPRQRVRWVRLSPHPWTLRRDAHDQNVATARVSSIAPGGAECFSWIASVDLAEEHHRPVPVLTTGRRRPRGYVADHPTLGIASEPVIDAADEVRRRAHGDYPLALAEAAADFVHERVEYQLAGGWDPAPRVLERGSGSCSESTFAFVAICRRLGLPARWLGGTMLRAAPAGRPCDQVFHRIAEVWLPEHGWCAVETQRTAPDPAVAEPPAEDATGDAHAAAPPLPRSFLLLARGDASGDAPLENSYHARETWDAPTGDVRSRGFVSRRAYWLSGVEDRLAFRGARHGLADGNKPSFQRAEMLACDARRFGAATGVDGHRIADAPPAVDAGLATELLLAAGHPEGLRLAVETHRDDLDALESAVGEHCSEDLLTDLLDAAARDTAQFERWWASVQSRLHPDPRGRITLR